MMDKVVGLVFHDGKSNSIRVKAMTSEAEQTLKKIISLNDIEIQISQLHEIYKSESIEFEWHHESGIYSGPLIKNKKIEMVEFDSYPFLDNIED